MFNGRALNIGEVSELNHNVLVQAVSKMRGGERKKTEKHQDHEMSSSETDSAAMMSDKETMIQLMEENEANRKIIESMSEGSEVEMEEKMRLYLAQFQKVWAGVRNRWINSKRESEGQLKKKRKKGRVTGKTEQGQDKKVCFAEEELPEEMQP